MTKHLRKPDAERNRDMRWEDRIRFVFLPIPFQYPIGGKLPHNLFIQDYSVGGILGGEGVAAVLHA